MVKHSYEVIQHYREESPEAFGAETFDHKPFVGEIVQLHWADGDPAYTVRVSLVDSHLQRLHVRSVPKAEVMGSWFRRLVNRLLGLQLILGSDWNYTDERWDKVIGYQDRHGRIHISDPKTWRETLP